MALDNFKLFVRNNPSLINFVKSNEMTWQGFYELFDLYGPNSKIWDKYIKQGVTETGGAFKDIFNMFKNIDKDELQKGITSLQKGIGYVSDLLVKKGDSKDLVRNTYEPRPIYKHLDD